ncbi:MAG: FadR/GntR family transcriptional regulator [Magnetospirillum sp.]|nr:FadR/GntR family transcriptional regulator [Magnetospirillum sp.]
MTRQQKSRPDLTLAERVPADATDLFGSIRKSRSLVGEIAERLSAEIASGRYAAGQRLPTEQAMALSGKVSRTVVREAISVLKAQGLVTTRQGSGAFVADQPRRQEFRIDPELLRSLDSVIEVLELRQAVETEAAGLAAARATPQMLADIQSAHRAMLAAVSRDESGADEDFSTHLAIAAATGNPQFLAFLNFLGTIVIPRRNRRVWSMTSDHKAAYLARIEAEHGAIVDAISAGNADGARRAMREHLVLAAVRYRSFANAAARGAVDPQSKEN